MKRKIASLICILAAAAISIPLTVFASTTDGETGSTEAVYEESSVRRRPSRTPKITVDSTDEEPVDSRARSHELRLADRAKWSAQAEDPQESESVVTNHKMTGENSVESRISSQTDGTNSSAAVHVYQTHSSDDFVAQTMVFTSYYDEIVSAYVDFDMLYSGKLDFSPSAKFTCYSQLIITYDGGKTATLSNRSTTQYTANDCQSTSQFYGYTYNLAAYQGITRIVWTMRLDLVSSTTGQYYIWYKSQTGSEILAQAA